MKWPAFTVLLALSSCASVAPAPEAGPAYRAIGTEPFWSVTIDNGQMVYDSPDGPKLTVPAPAPRTSFNGHRYETPRLIVDVTHGQCSDGMSDRVYADTVRVNVDGRELKGCGGAVTETMGLAGTNWSISAIDGEAVSEEDYFLNFAGDRLNGKAGCNSFSGNYQLSDFSLSTGPLAVTRMACPGERMAHEAKALAALQGPVRIEQKSGDTLLLRSEGGTLTLRRAP